MNQIFSILLMSLSFSAVNAATSVGQAPGLANSGLLQFECTIESQEINPETGDMGNSNSIYKIVVAPEVTSAKATALNSLKFYGPVDGNLAYITADKKQFFVKKITCH